MCDGGLNLTDHDLDRLMFFFCYLPNWTLVGHPLRDSKRLV
jgi:hypothetical protein